MLITGEEGMEVVLGVIAIPAIISAIIVVYIWYVDKYEREPLKYVILMFSWGILSAMLALFLEELSFGLMSYEFLYIAFIGPVIEEFSKALGLFANVRPTFTFPSLIDKSPLKKERIDGTDLVFLRELTGGIYFGEKGRKIVFVNAIEKQNLSDRIEVQLCDFEQCVKKLDGCSEPEHKKVIFAFSILIHQ